MGAKLGSWWQQIQKHRVAIGVGAIVCGVVIVIIIIGYWFDWTGFNGYNKVTTTHIITGTNAGAVTRTEEYQPGKTLWDWLQLLIIPVVLAVAALLFNLANNRTERQISIDKQREDLLQSYLDRIAELILKENLLTSPTKEVRQVATVRTITVLTQLDARRVGYVFTFLREAGLLLTTPDDSAINVSRANFRMVNWSKAELYEIKLFEADLSGANLYGTDLYGASLIATVLTEANLRQAILCDADLFATQLTDADLRGADLSGAILTEANLKGADLRGANMRRVTGITVKELEKQAKSLKGATMPDGSIHP